MITSKKKRLTNRDERILLLLKEFDFLTRDQLNQYFNLGKVRNTNRVLYNLSDYLMSLKEGVHTVYYLSKLGREYVGCDKVRKKGNHVMHTIMRNQFWLYYGCPHDWQNEIKMTNGERFIVVDAKFSKNGFNHFLEVDNLQSMKENRNKIERYKDLLQVHLNQFGYHATLVWITTTELRRKQLEEFCKGLKVKVFTIDEIQ